eukprot:2349155-Rhodomonas_salina.3
MRRGGRPSGGAQAVAEPGGGGGSADLPPSARPVLALLRVSRLPRRGLISEIRSLKFGVISEMGVWTHSSSRRLLEHKRGFPLRSPVLSLCSMEEKITICNLPPGLLGRLWPSERVVMGIRVCRSIRQQLASHAQDVVLRKGVGKQLTAGDVAKSVRRFDVCPLAFWWNPASEECWNAMLGGMEAAVGVGKCDCRLITADKVLYWGAGSDDPRLGPKGATRLAA